MPCCKPRRPKRCPVRRPWCASPTRSPQAGTPGGLVRMCGRERSFCGPAGVGFVEGRPVFLMPGNPVSCLCAYDLFAGRAVRRLGGRPADLPYRSAILPLGRKIASAVGRVDYVRVAVQEGKVEPLATSGASVLSSTTRADGFVLVPRDSEGHPPGDA